MKEKTFDMSSLRGKKVAITGATGTLGTELCRLLLKNNAELILISRNKDKAHKLETALKTEFKDAKISHIFAALENFDEVKAAVAVLKNSGITYFVHNAGIYGVKKYKLETGLNNVFSVNFAHAYYMIKELLETLKTVPNARVIAVGSIAHNYSTIDENDVDFSSVNACSKVYGNSKRFLMFSLYELFKNTDGVKLSLVHPGITFTGITSHYPKWLFAIIKYPMKIIFMPPKMAVKSLFYGFFEDCGYHEWIGPKLFNVWGNPKKKRLSTCSSEESRKIFEISEQIYKSLKGE